jgi:hypothetical protein
MIRYGVRQLCSHTGTLAHVAVGTRCCASALYSDVAPIAVGTRCCASALYSDVEISRPPREWLIRLMKVENILWVRVWYAAAERCIQCSLLRDRVRMVALRWCIQCTLLLRDRVRMVALRWCIQCTLLLRDRVRMVALRWCIQCTLLLDMK